MIKALEDEDDLFILKDGNGPKEISSTFYNKDKIKKAGGKWDVENKYWTITTPGLNKLENIKIYKKALSEDGEIVLVSDDEIEKGIKGDSKIIGLLNPKQIDLIKFDEDPFAD